MIKNKIYLQATVSLFFFLIAGIFTGCDLPTYTPNGPSPSPTDPPQKSILFTATENGWRHFYTNEVKFLGAKGYSFWIMGEQLTQAMESFEIECYKTSGYRNQGYGVIFSIKDTYHFLYVLINADGDYLIGKAMGMGADNEINTTTIQDWTSPTVAMLHQEYSSINTIKVLYNSVTNHYEIYFNETKETYFDDNIDTAFDKVGRYGYIACIDPNENFPEAGTEVWFKQISPVDIKLDYKPLI